MFCQKQKIVKNGCNQRERTQIISSRVKGDDTRTNPEQFLFHVRLQILFFTTEVNTAGIVKIFYVIAMSR